MVEQKEPWDVDTVYRKINAKGRWQICVYLLHCLMYTTLAFHYLVFVFQVDTPSHHCKIPENSTKNESIPQVWEEGAWVDDRCHIYLNRSISNATVKCTEWQFDPHSGYIATTVTDFNLVCGKNILVEISIMISNLVLAICQVFATKLADTYGRKPVFLAALALRMIFGVAKAFSPNMITFIIMDALIHFSMTGFTATLLVMSMELFPTEHRSMAGTTLEFFWFIGLMFTSMVVYFFRNWRVLQVVIHAPFIIGIAYYWLIDESVPWLMASKQYAKAEKVIRKGAKFNKVPITDDLFHETKLLPSPDCEMKALTSPPNIDKENNISGSTTSLTKRTGNGVFGSSVSLSSVAEALGRSMHGSGPMYVKVQNGISTHTTKKEDDDDRHSEQVSALSVLKSKRMLMISMILFVLWFTNSIVYTVINLTVTHLAGDRYLNFFLLNLAELPAIVSFHWACNRFGRRWPICIYHIICGIALLLTLIQVFGVDAPWLGITLNFVGKFAITASYCAILVYAPELYPTNVRSMFFGLCWFWAYIAQLVAPYCRPLEVMVPGLVRGTCGCLSIIVGLLVLLLPETFMRPFPKTVAEIENWTITVSEEERQRYKDMSKKNTAEEDA